MNPSIDNVFFTLATSEIRIFYENSFTVIYFQFLAACFNQFCAVHWGKISPDPALVPLGIQKISGGTQCRKPAGPALGGQNRDGRAGPGRAGAGSRG